MVFLFATFVLDARRLIGVALFYLGCYGTVVWLLSIWRPETTEVRLEDFRLLFFAALMAWFTALGFYIGRLRSKLERANEELASALVEAKALSRRDALTGCYNRRHAMEQLELETKRAARGSALSLCLADLDEFKVINDTLGHGAGDEVLKRFAGAATRSLRATDFVARFGGEEFLFVFSQTPAADGALVAERIRRAVAEIDVPSLADGNRVTVSIGVAEHRTPDPIDQTLSRADEALYRAKREGGNRVVLAS
jgi:diguanylate cyclase (GGDEF)-like protein